MEATSRMERENFCKATIANCGVTFKTSTNSAGNIDMPS